MLAYTPSGLFHVWGPSYSVQGLAPLATRLRPFGASRQGASARLTTGSSPPKGGPGEIEACRGDRLWGEIRPAIVTTPVIVNRFFAERSAYYPAI